MPSDITGSEILEEDRGTGKKSFRFLKGPVFANIILADEINRTPPKTQSALLEAMQEYRVTTSGQTFTLDEPFFVLATQNPIEQEGTYPLPEAQLDRFMFSLWLDYPSFTEEIEIVKRTTAQEAITCDTIISAKDILEFQSIIKNIPIADNTIEYAVKLVSATRPGTSYCDEKLADWIRWGAGPRASQCLILGAKVRAILNNRLAPDIDDVKNVAPSVLRHRLVTSFSAESEGIGIDEIISYIFKRIE
jgi:MoxR-like ATPase